MCVYLKGYANAVEAYTVLMVYVEVLKTVFKFRKLSINSFTIK